MPTPRPLTDPATRLELRDAATCAWHECAEDDSPRVRARHVAQYLRSLGYLATVELRPRASSFVTVNAISPTGSGEVLALAWEPHIDGFDYEESGEDADAIDGPPPDSLLSPDPAESSDPLSAPSLPERSRGPVGPCA